MFILQERVSKAKHIQYVSGVRSWVYWLANFSWDMIIILVAAALVTAIVAIMDISGLCVNVHHRRHSSEFLL